MSKKKENADSKDISKISRLNTDKSLKMLIIGLISLFIVLGVGSLAFVLYKNRTKSINIKDANDPATLVDRYIRKSILDAVDSVDHKFFDIENPATLFDTNAFNESMQKNAEDSKYSFEDSNSWEIGDVIYEAMELQVVTDSMGLSDVEIEMSLDSYVEVTEEYLESNAYVGSPEEFIELYESIQNSDLAEYDGIKNYAEVKILIESGKEKIDADLEVTLFEGDAFINVKTLEYTKGMLNQLQIDEDVRTVTNDKVRITLDDIIEIIKDANTEDNVTTSTVPTDLSADDFEEYLNSIILSNFAMSGIETEEQVAAYLQIMKSEVKNFVQNTEFIVDIKEVDSIREINGLSCYQGKVNVKDIVDNYYQMALNMNNRVIESGNLDGLSRNAKRMVEEIEILMEVANGDVVVASGAFGMEIRFCADSDNQIVGFGTDIDVLEPAKLKMNLDYIGIEDTTGFEIKKPENYRDLTQPISKLLIDRYVYLSSRSAFYADEILEQAEAVALSLPEDAVNTEVRIVTNPEFLKKYGGEAYEDVANRNYVIIYNNYMMIYDAYKDEVIYEGEI